MVAKLDTGSQTDPTGLRDGLTSRRLPPVFRTSLMATMAGGHSNPTGLRDGLTLRRLPSASRTSLKAAGAQGPSDPTGLRDGSKPSAGSQAKYE